jgi:hypothetical protein
MTDPAPASEMAFPALWQGWARRYLRPGGASLPGGVAAASGGMGDMRKMESIFHILKTDKMKVYKKEQNLAEESENLIMDLV